MSFSSWIAKSSEYCIYLTFLNCECISVSSSRDLNWQLGFGWFYCQLWSSKDADSRSDLQKSRRCVTFIAAIYWISRDRLSLTFIWIDWFNWLTFLSHLIDLINLTFLNIYWIICLAHITNSITFNWFNQFEFKSTIYWIRCLAHLAATG